MFPSLFGIIGGAAQGGRPDDCWDVANGLKRILRPIRVKKWFRVLALARSEQGHRMRGDDVSKTQVYAVVDRGGMLLRFKCVRG